MSRSTEGSTQRGGKKIQFDTYNIPNGQNRVLELALRGMSKANMYLGNFQ